MIPLPTDNFPTEASARHDLTANNTKTSKHEGTTSSTGDGTPHTITAAAGQSYPTDLRKRRVFTCFRWLPAELRQKIWKMACLHPRHIDLWVQKMNSLSSALNSPHRLFRYCTHTRTPVLLRTTRESREVGLRNYSLAFGTHIDDEYGWIAKCGRVASLPAKIYVNWEVDIIHPINLQRFTPAMLRDLTTHTKMSRVTLPLYCPELFHIFLDHFNLELLTVYLPQGLIHLASSKFTHPDHQFSRVRYYHLVKDSERKVPLPRKMRAKLGKMITPDEQNDIAMNVKYLESLLPLLKDKKAPEIRVEMARIPNASQVRTGLRGARRRKTI